MQKSNETAVVTISVDELKRLISNEVKKETMPLLRFLQLIYPQYAIENRKYSIEQVRVILKKSWGTVNKWVVTGLLKRRGKKIWHKDLLKFINDYPELIDGEGECCKTDLDIIIAEEPEKKIL